MASSPLLVVLGAVGDLGMAAHVAAQHGYRVAFPATVSQLISVLRGPGAKVVLLIPPLAETRGDTLARALRRVYPGMPVALSFGASAIRPDVARLLWLTAEPLAVEMMELGAQIGALAAGGPGESWDGATWEIDPLRVLAARSDRVERHQRRAPRLSSRGS